MILRDPVHGLVAFEGPAEQVVTRLLATRELQRLRNVRQLGFTSLVFPGAEHSRFAHSLGSAHVLSRFLNRMRDTQSELPADMRLDPETEMDALAAALCHDLGHGPFSHLFEDVLPRARSHEAWTQELILDPGTDVHRALRSLSEGMPERVAQLLRGDHRLGYLCRAISGTLDADRCDYLLRDSHMTGVSYGVYDLDWLLQALTFGQCPSEGGNGEWVQAIEGRKGLPPIEGFFLARQFMYQQVYHHKATRAAEALIRGIFARTAELIRQGTAPDPVPAALRAAALGEPVTLGQYADLDDVQLLSAFRAWESAGDPLLSELTKSLALRRLPKTVPLPDDGERDGRWQRALDLAYDVARQSGIHPEFTVFLDVPADKPYSEPAKAAESGLWVRIRHQPIRRLGDISFLLGELRNKRIERPRLIFPARIRDQVLTAVEPVIS